MKLKWYDYLMAFLAGIFLANAMPHFLNGISGNPFPTPFASPPGKGLSSPLLNVIWGSANFAAGFFFFNKSRILQKEKLSVILFFSGVLLMALALSLAAMLI